MHPSVRLPSPPPSILPSRFCHPYSAIHILPSRFRRVPAEARATALPAHSSPYSTGLVPASLPCPSAVLSFVLSFVPSAITQPAVSSRREGTLPACLPACLPAADIFPSSLLPSFLCLCLHLSVSAYIYLSISVSISISFYILITAYVHLYLHPHPNRKHHLQRPDGSPP